MVKLHVFSEALLRSIWWWFWDNFLKFSIKKLCCWYSVEAPRWGASYEYPQHTCSFLWRNKKSYPRLITKYPTFIAGFVWMIASKIYGVYPKYLDALYYSLSSYHTCPKIFLLLHVSETCGIHAKHQNAASDLDLNCLLGPVCPNT